MRKIIFLVLMCVSTAALAEDRKTNEKPEQRAKLVQSDYGKYQTPFGIARGISIYDDGHVPKYVPVRDSSGHPVMGGGGEPFYTDANSNIVDYAGGGGDE